MHLIQIIGEAASGLSDDLVDAHPEVPWRQIVAIRNRVVHGYFEVDLDILWDVALGDVPGFAERVRAIRAGLRPTMADCTFRAAVAAHGGCSLFPTPILR